MSKKRPRDPERHIPAETLSDRDRRREPFSCVQPGTCRTSASVSFLSPVCLSLADGPFVCLALCLFVSLFACLPPGSPFLSPLLSICRSRLLRLSLPSACPLSMESTLSLGSQGLCPPPDLGQVPAFPSPDFGSQFPPF